MDTGLSLHATRTDNTVTLQPRPDAKLRVVMQTTSHLASTATDVDSPLVGLGEESLDPLEHLETEEAVAEATGLLELHKSAQDSVAERVMPNLFEGGSTTLGCDEAVDLARWLNRKRSAIRARGDSEVHEVATILLGAWSEELLDAVFA